MVCGWVGVCGGAVGVVRLWVCGVVCVSVCECVWGVWVCFSNQQLEGLQNSMYFPYEFFKSVL